MHHFYNSVYILVNENKQNFHAANSNVLLLFYGIVCVIRIALLFYYQYDIALFLLAEEI